jgi:hypothetical protein
MVSYQLAHGNAEGNASLSKNVGVISMAAARNGCPNTAERLKLFSGLCWVHHLATQARSSASPAARHFKPSVFRFGWRTLDHQEGSGDFLKLPKREYAFATSHPAVATVLPGTTSPATWAECSGGLGIMLTSREIERCRLLPH